MNFAAALRKLLPDFGAIRLATNRLPNLPIWVSPVAVVCLIYVATLSLYILAFGGDVSALVCASSTVAGREPFQEIHVSFPTGGYDGQHYYAIARNPFNPPSEYLDFPSYRCARILFPFVAWAVSGGGDPRILLWAMPAINLIAVLGIAWLGVVVATHHGRSRWWGLLLPLAIHALTPAMRNLTDPLALLSITGLVTAWILRWPSGVLLIWGIACVLSREQNIVAVGIVLMAAIYRQEYRRSAAMALAGLIWLGWMAYLRHRFGALPFSTSNVTTPLKGISDAWLDLAAGPLKPLSFANQLYGLTVLTAYIVVSPLMVRESSKSIALLGLAGTGLALAGGFVIYENIWGYMRVFTWMPLAIWFWAVTTGRRWPALILASSLLWPLMEVVKAHRMIWIYVA